MALVNYSDLKTSIADWLNRSDLTSVIPDFISLAEASFNKEIRNRKMIKRATATIDSQYSAVPADWLQTVDFVVEANPIRFFLILPDKKDFLPAITACFIARAISIGFFA